MIQHAALGTNPAADEFALGVNERAWAMETIEVIEGEDRWTVRHGEQVLFIDTAEARTFQTALAISDTLFDQGVRSQVVLVRLDS